MLDGLVRTAVVESSDSEKSGNIVVTINVKSSSPTCNSIPALCTLRIPSLILLDKDNIRISQQDNNISISTGGLPLLSQLTAPRLTIEITISLPRTIGDLDIKTLSLPIFIESVENANDVVIHTHSASIFIGNIEAHSLTVSTHSGSLVFESSTKQHTSKFINITNSSGSSNLRSSLFSPLVSAESSSGTLLLRIATTATELKVKANSGSTSGEVKYVEDEVSVSSYENTSGSLDIKMIGWTGFLTAESRSGSKDVRGRGLERWNEGWKKGHSDSTAAFRSHSGSIKVGVL
jgi:hypothetical protein